MSLVLKFDRVAFCVHLSVSLFVTRLRCAKAAERIEVLFDVETLLNSGYTVLD